MQARSGQDLGDLDLPQCGAQEFQTSHQFPHEVGEPIDRRRTLNQRLRPFFVQTPIGDLFHYGPTPTMHRLNLAGAGSIQSLGTLNEDWYPKHGISVLYDEGKVLVAGGASAGDVQASTSSAMEIDVNGFAPIVTPLASNVRPAVSTGTA